MSVRKISRQSQPAGNSELSDPQKNGRIPRPQPSFIKMQYYRSVECPRCKQAMEKVRWHISYNANENDKEYDHTTYQCKTDDVWVTTEIPKDDSNE